MWDVIGILALTSGILWVEMDVWNTYKTLSSAVDEYDNKNVGMLRIYPEVRDFYCPTCHRHFSSYDHCYKHAELRKHNKSSLFCSYSFFGLPKCHRTKTSVEEDYQFGSCCFAGRKRTMEDIHWVSQYDIINEKNAKFPVLYGMCDGHRGTNAAVFLSNQIEEFLLMRRHDSLPTAGDMKDAFEEARNSYIRDFCQKGDSSGSTSTLLIKNDDELIIANIGDSSAFICCDKHGNPFTVTKNHRVTDYIEASSIKEKGGRIKDQRLFGQLALSRSFGDCLYSPYLSVEPYIYSMQINPDYHFYMVLATDGVWDYVLHISEEIISRYR